MMLAFLFICVSPNPFIAQLIQAEWCILASIKYVIIGSYNDFSSVWHWNIIWTNTDLVIGFLVIYFC